MRKVAYIVFSSVVAFIGVGSAVAQRTTPEYDDDSGPVVIFFVRHGEADGELVRRTLDNEAKNERPNVPALGRHLHVRGWDLVPCQHVVPGTLNLWGTTR